MRSILSTSLAVLALGSAVVAQNQNLVFITNEAVGGTVAPTAGVIGDGVDTDNTRKVLVFDIDFDGDDDVYFLNHDNTSQGLINDGTGVFTADASGTVLYTATSGVGSKGAFASDVDGDGDMDVFVATGPVAGVQQNNLWLANISAPGPSASAFFDVSGSEPVHTDHSYDAASLNLNGSLAIIVANRTGTGVTGQNRIYDDTNGDGAYLTVAPADGTFNSDNGAEVRNCRDLVVGDFDGDGLDDVFVANAGNSNEINQIFRQSGASLVDDAVATFGANPGNSYGAAAADLNGDGLLDLAVSNRLTSTTGQSNFLFQNTSSVGDVEFTAVAGTAVDGDSRASYDVTFGDVDGDGDSDVIVANNNDDNAVFMNNQIENGVATANFFTQAAADMFSQISDGLLQDNGGRTRSAIIAEFGAYGPDANHQGSEVVFANAITGSNEFYRGMGKQFFDLGGATSGNITPTLEGDGFFSPSTGGSLVIGNASANRPAFLTMDIVNFNNPFNGGTQLVDLGSGTAFISGLFNLDGTGGLDLVVAAGDIPASLSGTQLFVQVATEDLSLPGNFGITNGVSLIIQ